MILLFAAIILVLPIMVNNTAILGVDSYFQYNRIYEAAMQLQHHQLSFINLYSFQQAGRVVNQVYSPLLTYLCGALLLLLGTWIKFQVVSIVIVSFVAGYAMYRAGRRLKISPTLSVLLGLLYLSSFSVYSFIFGTNWRAIAVAVVPLLVGPMANLMSGHWSFKAMAELGLILSLINQIQLMTTILIIPGLLPFFVLGLIRSTEKWRAFGRFIAGMVLALFLSANVIAPYLELLRGDTILPPTSFPLVNGVTNLTMPVLPVNQPWSLAILGLIFYIGLGLLIGTWRKTTWWTRLLVIVAMLYIILGTSWFPWQLVDRFLPMMQKLQFPRRFTIIGIPWLLLGVASLINEGTNWQRTVKAKRWLLGTSAILAVASILSLAVTVNRRVTIYQDQTISLATGLQAPARYVAGHQLQGRPVTKITALQPAFHTHQLGALIQTVDRTTPDYLPVRKIPVGGSYYTLYNQQIIQNQRSFDHQVKSAGRLVVTWTAKRAGTRIVPVIKYARTKLVLNGRALNRVQTTSLGTLRIHQRAGRNRLQLSYRTSWLTRASIILATGLWGFIIISGVGVTIKRQLRA